MHRTLIPLMAAIVTLPATAQRIIGTRTLSAHESVRQLRPATDTDGDGFADFVAVVRDDSVVGSYAYRVDVISGSDGAVFFQLGPDTAGEPSDALGFGDADGDGHGDVAVTGNGLQVYSGATGALLYSQPIGFLSLCELGDWDGNGRDDFAGASYNNGHNTITLLRGEDGTALGTMPAISNSQGYCTLRSVGDLTGDGRQDLAIGLIAGATTVLDSATGATIRVINPPGNDPERRIETIDLDRDGKREVLLLRGQVPIDIEVYGGEDGMLRYTVVTPPGTVGQVGRTACSLGDLDADGYLDFAASTAGSPAGQLFAISGRDGRLLWSLQGDPLSSIGNTITRLGDIDGDGRGDFACSFAGAYSGDGWHLISSKVLADVQPQSGACGGGPFLPRLGITRPILGQAMTIVGLDGPTGVDGIVAFSLRPAFPVFLGVSSCFAYFDLGGGIALATTTQPNWSMALPLPSVPQLAGLEIALQCFYAPTSGPLGLDLSNGIWARLGYP